MSDLKKPVARSLPEDSVDEYHQRMAAKGNTPHHGVHSEPGRATSVGAVLNLKEAAVILHCHPKTLRLMAQAQKIPARRVGKLWRFSEERLRQWLEAS